MLALLHELLEREVTYEQFISFIEELSDEVIFALVAESAEVLLFLLFEDEHLVTEVVLGEKPINQHQVLPYVEQEGVGLRKGKGTCGRIYF